MDRAGPLSDRAQVSSSAVEPHVGWTNSVGLRDFSRDTAKRDQGSQELKNGRRCWGSAPRSRGAKAIQIAAGGGSPGPPVVRRPRSGRAKRNEPALAPPRPCCQPVAGCAARLRRSPGHRPGRRRGHSVLVRSALCSRRYPLTVRGRPPDFPPPWRRSKTPGASGPCRPRPAAAQVRVRDQQAQAAARGRHVPRGPVSR